MRTVVLACLAAFVAVMIWDAVRYYGGGFIARRRAIQLEDQIEQALALCDPSAPIFARTLADMPDAAKPMGDAGEVRR